ncbi:MAG: hypothetical protein UW94_C0021G0001, partial [Parcubacteria group bacterium GW2011_GWA2_45_14]
LLLVSAMIGEVWKEAYLYAARNEFQSYGVLLQVLNLPKILRHRRILGTVNK